MSNMLKSLRAQQPGSVQIVQAARHLAWDCRPVETDVQHRLSIVLGTLKLNSRRRGYAPVRAVFCVLMDMTYPTQSHEDEPRHRLPMPNQFKGDYRVTRHDEIVDWADEEYGHLLTASQVKRSLRILAEAGILKRKTARGALCFKFDFKALVRLMYSPATTTAVAEFLAATQDPELEGIPIFTPWVSVVHPN